MAVSITLDKSNLNKIQGSECEKLKNSENNGYKAQTKEKL